VPLTFPLYLELTSEKSARIWRLLLHHVLFAVMVDWSCNILCKAASLVLSALVFFTPECSVKMIGVENCLRHTPTCVNAPSLLNKLPCFFATGVPELQAT